MKTFTSLIILLLFANILKHITKPPVSVEGVVLLNLSNLEQSSLLTTNMKSSKNTHSWTTKIQYGGHQQYSKIAKSPSFNEMLSDFGEIWYITAYYTVTPSHGSVVRASQREKTNLPPLTTPTPLN